MKEKILMALDRVLHGEWEKPLQNYLDRRQATVAELVTLRPIFKVYANETGYKGGGNLHEPWRRQAEEEKQQRATLNIFWRRQGSGGNRNPVGVAGEGGEDGEVTVIDG